MTLETGVSVVIPCLNEAETIVRAINQAKEALRIGGRPGEVVIGDNGSTDGSQKLATDAGARVVDVEARGYGAALDGGIRAARYAWVAFGDADLSYPFDEIEQLILPLESGQCEFVLGSRLKGKIEPGAMPLLNRYIGTPILSFLIRFFYGLNTTDCNSGMRALRRDKYELLRLTCPGMEYASEMLIRVAQHDIPYKEVNISFRKDQRNRAPHLRRWRDGWRHLRFILGNAPSKFLILAPAISGTALLLGAILLSYGSLWNSAALLHFHSAFIFIAVAVPLIMFAISFALIKALFHEMGHVDSRFVRLVSKMSETSAAFYLSALFYFFAAFEMVFVFYKWYQAGFGNLFELGPVIRISAYTILATALFSFDMGLGIIRLIPFRKR